MKKSKRMWRDGIQKRINEEQYGWKVYGSYRYDMEHHMTQSESYTDRFFLFQKGMLSSQIESRKLQPWLLDALPFSRAEEIEANVPTSRRRWRPWKKPQVGLWAAHGGTLPSVWDGKRVLHKGHVSKSQWELPEKNIIKWYLNRSHDSNDEPVDSVRDFSDRVYEKGGKSPCVPTGPDLGGLGICLASGSSARRSGIKLKTNLQHIDVDLGWSWWIGAFYYEERTVEPSAHWFIGPCWSLVD